MKIKGSITDNSMIDGHTDRWCLHNKTKVVDWCSNFDAECQTKHCTVMDDDMPDCEFRTEKEVCKTCLEPIA